MAMQLYKVFFDFFKNNSPKRFKHLKTGDELEVTKVITHRDVLTFAKLTDDFNPVHFNLQNNIVHGALLNGLLSGVLGTKLPGAGTIVVEQWLKYPNPCFVGDTIRITVKILSVRKIIKCGYLVTTHGTNVVLEGEAKLVVREMLKN